MQIGIFAKTFAGTTPEAVLSAAAEAGFAAVHYNMACSGLPAMPDAITNAQADAVGAAAAACKVSIAGISGTYNMIHPDTRVRRTGLERLERLAAQCGRMSASLITLCSGTRDPHDQWRHHPENGSASAWKDLLTEMEKALAIAERWNLDLGIEPELANVVNGADTARALIRTLSNRRIRIVLDPANLFERATLAEQRRILSSAIDKLGGDLAMAHAKDRTADGSFIAAGKGVVDFRHFLSALKATGFDGPLVTHGLAASEAPGVATFLKEVLQESGAAI